RYGRHEVESWYWEAWNEPNIGYWQGADEEYFKLYDYTARAVKRALPTARMGGPHSTGPGSEKAAAFLRAFLEHCARTGAPLDFIGFHAKGRPEIVDGHVRMGIQKQLNDIAKGFEIVASFPEFRDLPIIIGESDPEGCAACSVAMRPANAYRNGTLYPVYNAAVFPRIYELADKHGVNIRGALSWAFEFEDQAWFAGFRSLATNGINKPVLNVFRMFAMMGGERVKVTSDRDIPLERILASGVRAEPDIGAMASRRDRAISVLLWNYHDDDVAGPDAAINLEVAGLPAEARRVLLRHYRIDRDHGNAYTLWQQMGAPQEPTPEQYARLEAAGQLELLTSPSYIRPAGGKATLDFALPRQGVSLVELSWEPPPAALKIEVTDETGKPIWTRLEVRDEDGGLYQPAKATLDKPINRNVRGGFPFYRGSFVVNGKARLDLSPGRYTVVAEHGLEYTRAERRVDIAHGDTAAVNIQLRPWVRMRERGWYSADLHVHRPLEQTKALALAEDVNLSVVTTIWNARTAWADRPPPPTDVIRASDNHLITFLNAEDERGGGAWMLYNLTHPIRWRKLPRWFPTGYSLVEEQRRKHNPPPWFEIEKLIWWEAPVMVALAKPDSIGLLHNHFNQYSVMDDEAWGRPRDRERYPGREGFTEYCLELYYRYLNLGFRLPPTAGSASGVLPNPVGFNRVYVPIEGEFTVEKWFASLRAGRTLVTNGPILTLERTADGFTVTAEAREPIDRIEIVANGEVVKRFGGEGGAFTLDTSRHTWIAARAFGASDDSVRLAHTSPTWLGGEWDATADAEFFTQWIDDLIAQTAIDRFASSTQRDQVLALYRRARDIYRKALSQRR
ncbi:MAG: hypothetical protein GY953_50950, partial [bacterium]|nr:hypothetical protein [bacterium]